MEEAQKTEASMIDRSIGFLALRLYNPPDRGKNPTDPFERKAVERAHDMSEVAIFNDSGDAVAVVKLMSGGKTASMIGIKAVPELLLCRTANLDAEQREKLLAFHRKYASHDRNR